MGPNGPERNSAALEERAASQRYRPIVFIDFLASVCPLEAEDR